MTQDKHVRRILNCIPSRDTERDWRFEHAEAAGLARAGKPPARCDLREPWWKIGDQKTTGSCVGWATTDGLLRWHFVKARRLGTDEPLSVRFIWMSAKETDEFTQYPTTFVEEAGTSLKAALDVARKFGVVPDSTLPFGTGDLFPGREEDLFALAAQRRIASYFRLEPDRWRNWLAAKGPILTRLEVDDTWYTAESNDGKLDVYHPETARGGHAVSLVGYTPEEFIVRNSWGVEWGDKGFAYASEAYARAAFTEAYGVLL